MIQVLQNGFYEKLINWQVLKNNLSYYNKYEWNTKFEILISKRNYHFKKRKISIIKIFNYIRFDKLIINIGFWLYLKYSNYILYNIN